MDSNIQGIIFIIVTVIILLVLGETFYHKEILSKIDARKFIHIGTGNIILFVPMFTSKLILTLVPAVFVGALYFLTPYSPIPKLRLKTFQSGHGLGTVYYALSLTFVVFFGFDSRWIIAASFIPVAYGDGLAAVIGSKATKGIFKSYGGTKTWIGTSMNTFSSFFAVFVFIVFFGAVENDINLQLAIFVALVAAYLSTLIELIAPKGMDNLFIPMVLTAVFAGFTSQFETIAQNVDLTQFLIGFILSFIIAIAGHKTRSLTTDGAITGFMIGLVIFGLGGWTFGLQLFVFFFLGTLATKLAKRRKGAKKAQDEFEKGGSQRDSKQAIAKAGLGSLITIFYVIFPSQIWIYFFSGTMASSLIDTLATEIGISFKGTPRRVLNPFKIAEKGESGVISAIGTFGSYFVGLVSYAIVFAVSRIDEFLLAQDISWWFLVIVPVGGTFGMLMDSVLGGTIQRHNICIECNKVLEATEHCGKPTEYHKGVSWLRNDLVNFFGTGSGGLFTVILYLIFLMFF